jgi:ribulose-phosphate 3-epimerase
VKPPTRAGNTGLWIEVDGGIGPDTVRGVAEAGANVFVAGNAVFRTKSYPEAIAAIRKNATG